ncbi:hypothetical protein [Actinoplanes awajinensis]|uniref:Uncharacterized protein n=1 Tax=Actinoplanes awajinensis subsp. mycoplanecinus TaxID=135947 RepID=A0A0X3UPP7_9ACTN|nr:hypothetical protein [Actinoplanes awajinensis]KUL33782.1 hypothetical protein ADL15_17475 [Actinoplanes awajinensis subsp. mycoplanecinus]
MFLSIASPAPARTGRLRPVQVIARRFGPDPEPYRDDPLLEEYLSDMTELYGRRFDRDRHAAASRNSFTTMADQLVRDLDLAVPVDLVVIAHSTPDADPRRVTACYLNELLHGDPLAFAVSDQGPVAPFTALRLLGTYSGDFPGCRALLLVLEQTTMSYEVTGARYPVPGHDIGVAVLLEPAGSDGVSVHQCPDVTPAAAGALLDDVVPADAVLITGRGMTAARPSVPAPDLGAAGVWAEFAQRRADTAGPIAVADHDPVSGTLCVAVFAGTEPEVRS